MKRHLSQDSEVTDIQPSTSTSSDKKLKRTTSATGEVKVPYDKSANNGFIFNDEYYIPEELLLDLLTHYIDHNTLRSCQSVCKQWNILIKQYVWRKKAELMLNHKLPLDEDTPWTSNFLICQKKPFNRNLIKNHSGQKSLDENHDCATTSVQKTLIGSRFRLRRDFNSNCDWLIRSDGGHGWAVESPPRGVPKLPDDAVFEGHNCCFVTSFEKSYKEQIIDLVKEGLSKYLLDTWQPTIKVSEWISSRYDCGGIYVCNTELIAEIGNNDVTLSNFKYFKRMRGEEQNKWFKFEHEFKNYGMGLRKIKFSHGGQDIRWWAGHYGSKMAGACITLEVPDDVPREVLTPQGQTLSSEEPYNQDWFSTRINDLYFRQDEQSSSEDSEEYSPEDSSEE